MKKIKEKFKHLEYLSLSPVRLKRKGKGEWKTKILKGSKMYFFKMVKGAL